MDIFTLRKYLIDTLAWRVVSLGLDEITTEVAYAQLSLSLDERLACYETIARCFDCMRQIVALVGTKRSS